MGSRVRLAYRGDSQTFWDVELGWLWMSVSAGVDCYAHWRRANLNLTADGFKHDVTVRMTDGSCFHWKNALVEARDFQLTDRKASCIFVLTEHYGHHHFDVDDVESYEEKDLAEVTCDIRPLLSDPCPRENRHGQHEIYLNAGPGGKRDRKDGWQCCQACGANGPTESPLKP